MALHQANQNVDDESELATARNARIGRWLFLVYAILYGGFMLLNTFAPALTGTNVLFGLNLAVCYGIGLILAAVLMAFLYGWLCMAPVNAPAQGSAGEENPGARP